jgi:hypothetical protein
MKSHDPLTVRALHALSPVLRSLVQPASARDRSAEGISLLRAVMQ